MKHTLEDAKCLVIKIGSSLLINSKTGKFHRAWFLTFIDDVVYCWQRGQNIVIVSSGSVALGSYHLKLNNSLLELEKKQAAAAIGQIKLAHAYQEILASHGVTTAQVLLTIDDSENRKRYLNAKNTLQTLLNFRAIPVINENDTVATAEIRYGDNDRLAARVAQMVSADTLVLLSDIEGLYTENPHLNPKAKFIPEVTKLTPEIMAMGSDSITEYGSGGMITKLAAAKIALSSGCRMVIAAGKYFHPLRRINKMAPCTWFIPDSTPTNERKNWIAHHLKTKGSMIINPSAKVAIQQGKSLLTLDIISIEGEFDKGDAIRILTANKQEIARGLTNYSAYEARKIQGHTISELENILGYHGSAEMIHHDDLVVY